MYILLYKDGKLVTDNYDHVVYITDREEAIQAAKVYGATTVKKLQKWKKPSPKEWKKLLEKAGIKVE